MDEPQFWEIIESGGRKALDDPERQQAEVRKRLDKLPPEELVKFHLHFNQKMAGAYIWDLWGAAYLMNGGCSDNGFAYFRAWLISRGQAVYSADLGNPDSLASIVDPDRDDYEFEDLWGVAKDVYEESTGDAIPEFAFVWPISQKSSAGTSTMTRSDRAGFRLSPSFARSLSCGAFRP
jgi:hypothetical protein